MRERLVTKECRTTGGKKSLSRLGGAATLIKLKTKRRVNAKGLLSRAGEKKGGKLSPILYSQS